MKSKKAASQIIWILLVIIILAIAAIIIIGGFVYGWSNFWEKITGQENIYQRDADIKAARNVCESDCSMGNYEAYCVNKFVTLKNQLTGVSPRCWQNPIYHKCMYYDEQEGKEVRINTGWCETNYPEAMQRPECTDNSDCREGEFCNKEKEPWECEKIVGPAE